MLKKVEITNFKNFNEKFTFDLNNVGDFEFNQECIKNGIVNTSIIYGQNGCGKSNLGLAIFDMVSHLTNKPFRERKYSNYLNANSKKDKATFKFTFVFNNGEVIYEYSKKDYETLISEKLTINNKIVIDIDREISTEFKVDLSGAENLKNDVKDSNISIVSYISNNTILNNDNINKLFEDFKVFIHNMLLTKTLDEVFYMGYVEESQFPSDYIIRQNKLLEFQDFLNNSGVECKLVSKEIDGKYQIFFKFKDKEIEFFKIASSGTKSLRIFYFWYLKIQEKKASFLFIDEFDAFYHQDVSETIVEKLKEITDTQVILTTHNTSNISNELLRPDCYFVMNEKEIKPLPKCTDRELREGHNIEKMYRANSFG